MKQHEKTTKQIEKTTGRPKTTPVNPQKVPLLRQQSPLIRQQSPTVVKDENSLEEYNEVKYFSKAIFSCRYDLLASMQAMFNNLTLFLENKEDLEFQSEVILNTMPLRVDMLLIKRKCIFVQKL